MKSYQLFALRNVTLKEMMALFKIRSENSFHVDFWNHWIISYDLEKKIILHLDYYHETENFILLSHKYYQIEFTQLSNDEICQFGTDCLSFGIELKYPSRPFFYL